MTQTNADTILDVLIVGGGPAGTAAAFRAKELGLNALVIDFDDVLKRIRDYPKDKLILPDFGGGDKMAFPAGGECISALQFEPIDKDAICEKWKGLYRQFEINVRTGIELSSVERSGDVWHVNTWDHKSAQAAPFKARHVVVALGRGVPRRFDIPGNTDGIAYRLDDAARYVNRGPVLVVGGGTSAAEAVVAISTAKIQAEDNCNVYWAYRGTKMPRVSKALADQFFEAYIGNGNIRHYPESEPVSMTLGPDRRDMLSLRIDRKTPEGRPPETVHLEFDKLCCIACIGEDIPEGLLATLGIAMVMGPQDKKMMAVTPLLETQQPNLYMIGDLLSQSYLETDDFAAPVDTFRQVKHRGNIKSSLRDGVFVAEVIKQRLEGRANVEVVIQNAGAPSHKDARVAEVLGLTGEAGEASVQSPADNFVDERGYLVVITPTGIEAEEIPLDTDGVTTIGRVDRDVTFSHDTLLSDAHASITNRNGEYYIRDDGSRSGTYLRVKPQRPVRVRDGDLLRAGRQILVVSHQVRGQPPQIEHYDQTGAHRGTYPLQGTVVLGRTGGTSNPDVILDDNDPTLSRFHLAIVVDEQGIQAQDFGSKNGTYLKVDAERKLEHFDIIRIGGQQLEIRVREDLPQKSSSAPVPFVAVQVEESLAPPPPPAQAPAPALTVTGAHVTFADQGKAGALGDTETLLAWADQNDVSIDYECWIGMCGCDAIRIVSGAEHLNDVTEKEIKTLKRKGLEPGQCRLACMTRASGPVVVEVVK